MAARRFFSVFLLAAFILNAAIPPSAYAQWTLRTEQEANNQTGLEELAGALAGESLPVPALQSGLEESAARDILAGWAELPPPAKNASVSLLLSAGQTARLAGPLAALGGFLRQPGSEQIWKGLFVGRFFLVTQDPGLAAKFPGHAFRTNDQAADRLIKRERRILFLKNTGEENPLTLAEGSTGGTRGHRTDSLDQASSGLKDNLELVLWRLFATRRGLTARQHSNYSKARREASRLAGYFSTSKPEASAGKATESSELLAGIAPAAEVLEVLKSWLESLTWPTSFPKDRLTVQVDQPRQKNSSFTGSSRLTTLNVSFPTKNQPSKATFRIYASLMKSRDDLINGVVNTLVDSRHLKPGDFRLSGPEELKLSLRQDLAKVLGQAFPPTAAGLEEDEEENPSGNPTGMRSLGEVRLGTVPAEILAQAGEYYLRIDKQYFNPGEEPAQPLWYLPLDAYPLVIVGTDQHSMVQISGIRSRERFSDRQSAVLLDFGGAIQALDLGSEAGTWVGGQRLDPPRFFRLAGLKYFLFQRGNRYFIAGEKIEGPDRLFVPFLEISFHGAMDVRNPKLLAVARLGRDSSNDVQIVDEKVSREHAELILLDDGSVWIRDLSSSNGTFVDGKKIRQLTLLYNPVTDLPRIQGEVWSYYPDFSKIMQRIREIALLDLDRDSARIAEAVRDLNRRLGDVQNASVAVELFTAATTNSGSDREGIYTIAMENYLGFFIERFLSRLRTFGKGEELSDPVGSLLFLFLLDPRRPKLQYEAAAGLRDLNLPARFSEESVHHVIARLITTEPARALFGRVLLEALGNLRGAPELMKLLKSGALNDGLRTEAIRVLGEHAKEAPEEDLFHLLARLSFDESKQVVLASMDALARMGRQEAALLLSAYAFPPSTETFDPEIQTKAEAVYHQLVQGLIDAKFRKTEERTQIIPTPKEEPPSGPKAGLEEASPLETRLNELLRRLVNANNVQDWTTMREILTEIPSIPAADRTPQVQSLLQRVQALRAIALVSSHFDNPVLGPEMIRDWEEALPLIPPLLRVDSSIWPEAKKALRSILLDVVRFLGANANRLQEEQARAILLDPELGLPSGPVWLLLMELAFQELRTVVLLFPVDSPPVHGDLPEIRGPLHKTLAALPVVAASSPAQGLTEDQEGRVLQLIQRLTMSYAEGVGELERVPSDEQAFKPALAVARAIGAVRPDLQDPVHAYDPERLLNRAAVGAKMLESMAELLGLPATAQNLHQSAMLAAREALTTYGEYYRTHRFWRRDLFPDLSAGLEEAIEDQNVGYVAVGGVAAVIPDGLTHVLAVTAGLEQTQALLNLKTLPPNRVVAVAAGMEEVAAMVGLGIPREQILEGWTFPSLERAKTAAVQFARRMLETLEGVNAVILEVTASTLQWLRQQLLELLPTGWQRAQPITEDNVEQVDRLNQLGV